MPEDPKAVLTRFITSGDEEPDQKTRIVSREQMAFTIAWGDVGAIDELEVPHMKDLAEKSEQLMMSFQGRRSDDIVEIARALDQQDMMATGVQEILAERKARRLKSHESRND